MVPGSRGPSAVPSPAAGVAVEPPRQGEQDLPAGAGLAEQSGRHGPEGTGGHDPVEPGLGPVPVQTVGPGERRRVATAVQGVGRSLQPDGVDLYAAHVGGAQPFAGERGRVPGPRPDLQDRVSLDDIRVRPHAQDERGERRRRRGRSTVADGRPLPVGLLAVELRDQRGVRVRGGEPPPVVELRRHRLPHRQPLRVGFVGGEVEAGHERVARHLLRGREPSGVNRASGVGIGVRSGTGEALHHGRAQRPRVGVEVWGQGHELPLPSVLRMSAKASVIANASGSQPHCPFGLHSIAHQSSGELPSPVRAKSKHPKTRPESAR